MTYAIISGDFGSSMLKELEKLEFDCDIKLTRFQKALLAEVATVEQLLSIIVDSPIAVKVVKQEHEGFKARREVWLNDKDGKNLIFAVTAYNETNLPIGVVDDLRAGRMGIGSVIMKYKLETYRRIKVVGYDPKTKTLFREYEILRDGATLFNIRESFSAENFLEHNV